MSFTNLFEQWEMSIHQEVFLIIFPQELDFSLHPRILKVEVSSHQGWFRTQMSLLLNIQNHSKKLDNIVGSFLKSNFDFSLIFSLSNCCYLSDYIFAQIEAYWNYNSQDSIL